MTQRRRSIVEFEKWVDGEIKRAEQDLNGLEREAADVLRRRSLEEVRLATLRTVKARLAFEVADPQLVFPDAEPEPEPVGAGANAVS